MSQNSENIKLVKIYLKQIEEELPDWLTENKDELKDVLDELEQHLWDKVEEIAEGHEPTTMDVQKATASMGTPKKIAGEYKRRGTPKIFISEELWPSYLMGLKIVFGIIFTLNLIGFIFTAIEGEWFTGLFSMLGNIFNGFAIGALIISAIFVFLSMEGYLPEDFKTKEEKEKIQELRQKGISHPVEKVEKVENPIKMGELIFGSILALIFGLLLVTQTGTLFGMTFNPLFTNVLRYAGILIVVSGILKFGRIAMGQKNITGHQILMGIDLITSLLGIPIALIIVNNPEIFPFFDVLGVEDIYNGITLGFKIIIGLTVLGVCVDSYELFALPQKHEKYLKYKHLFDA